MAKKQRLRQWCSRPLARKSSDSQKQNPRSISGFITVLSRESLLLKQPRCCLIIRRRKPTSSTWLAAGPKRKMKRWRTNISICSREELAKPQSAAPPKRSAGLSRWKVRGRPKYKPKRSRQKKSLAYRIPTRRSRSPKRRRALRQTDRLDGQPEREPRARSQAFRLDGECHAAETCA